MKVSLMHPRMIYQPSQPSLGLGNIAVCLEHAGHEVQFIEDAFADTDDVVVQQVKAFGAEYLPDVPLVYGGPHPSVVPEDSVKEESVDYVNEM